MSVISKVEILDLLERFNRSKALIVLTNEYRVKIRELISKGDEKAIQVIKKFLDDEDELEKYLHDFVEQKAEEGTKYVIQNFKKRKNSYNSMKDQEKSKDEAEKIINSI